MTIAFLELFSAGEDNVEGFAPAADLFADGEISSTA